MKDEGGVGNKSVTTSKERSFKKRITKLQIIAAVTTFQTLPVGLMEKFQRLEYYQWTNPEIKQIIDQIKAGNTLTHFRVTNRILVKLDYRDENNCYPCIPNGLKFPIAHAFHKIIGHYVLEKHEQRN